MKLFWLIFNAGLLNWFASGHQLAPVHPIGIPNTVDHQSVVDQKPPTSHGALVRIQSQTNHGAVTNKFVASESSEQGTESMADSMQESFKCPPGQMCDCPCNCHKIAPFYMGPPPAVPHWSVTPTAPPPPPPPPPPVPPYAPSQMSYDEPPEPPPLIPHEGLFEPMLSPASGGKPTLGPPEPALAATLAPGPSTGPPPTTTGEPTAPPPPTTTLPPPTTTTPAPTVTKKEWWTVPPASTTPWWWPGSIWATTKAPYPWWWDKATPEQEVAWKGGHNIRGTVGVIYGPYDFPRIPGNPYLPPYQPGTFNQPPAFVQEQPKSPRFDADKSKWTGKEFETELQQKMMNAAPPPGENGSKLHPVMNSPTGQAIFLDESPSNPSWCNCPACPKEPNIGGMPWEQEDWGNPWDKFMSPR